MCRSFWFYCVVILLRQDLRLVQILFPAPPTLEVGLLAAAFWAQRLCHRASRWARWYYRTVPPGGRVLLYTLWRVCPVLHTFWCGGPGAFPLAQARGKGGWVLERDCFRVRLWRHVGAKGVRLGRVSIVLRETSTSFWRPALWCRQCYSNSPNRYDVGKVSAVSLLMFACFRKMFCVWHVMFLCVLTCIAVNMIVQLCGTGNGIRYEFGRDFKAPGLRFVTSHRPCYGVI